jgi:hypothetical protein
MNSALIGISARREAWNGIRASGIYCSGIEAAAPIFFKTAVMGDGVMGGGWIVPPYRGPAGNRDSRWNVVRRSAVHQDPALRRRRAGWPDAAEEHNDHEKDARYHVNYCNKPLLMRVKPDGKDSCCQPFLSCRKQDVGYELFYHL